MNNNEFSPNESEKFPIVSNQDLSLFEHRFIGGTEMISEELYDSNRLKVDLLKGELSSNYFVPVSILKGTKKPETAAIDRNGKYIKGALSFLGESGMEAFEQGFQTIVELPYADPQTGVFTPEWRLFLLKDEKVEIDESILSKLKPIGIIAQACNFETRSDGIHMTYKSMA